LVHFVGLDRSNRIFRHALNPARETRRNFSEVKFRSRVVEK